MASRDRGIMIWWQTLLVTLGGGATTGVISLKMIQLMIYKGNNEQMKNEVIPSIEQFFKPIASDVSFLKKEFEEYSSMNKFEHKSIGRVLDRMGKQLEDTTNKFSIYEDNKRFYEELYNLAYSATERVGESKEAIKFINYQRDIVEKFSRWALKTGVRSITREVFEGCAFSDKMEGLKKASEIISPEFAEEYFNNYGYLTEEYLKNIRKIKNDTINNIDKRFKAITFTFMSDITSTFANFYYAKFLQEKKDDK